MDNNLKLLLREYEQKRNTCIADANLKKKTVMEKYPELNELDSNIARLSIKSIQMVLTGSSKNEIKNIKDRIEVLKKEKDNFIKSKHIDVSVFNPKFECSKCNDTGYISTPKGNVLCSCIKQKLYDINYNNSNIYDLENQNFDNFRLDFYSDIANPDKYHSKLSPRENIISIKKTCEKFIENFDDPSENNLLFCGNTGLGKTFLSSCIASECIKKGKTVLYQTSPIMLDKIIDYKFGKTQNDIVSTIYSVDLLIIDDLGTETKNSLKLTELFNLINSRLLNQNNKVTKTIISTNLTLQNLYDNYDERIVSRIIGNYNACYFFGEDIRIKKKIALKR